MITPANPEPASRASRPALPTAEMRLRVVSAAVMAPAAISALAAGPVFFAIVVAAIGAVMAYEWTRIVHGPGAPLPLGVLALGIGVAVAGAAVENDAVWIATAAVVACLLAMIGLRDASGAGWPALAGPYLVIPCALIVALRAGPEGFSSVLWLMITVWATDSAALLAGRLIGGPRLAPAWSPGKTWAGLAGGVVAATAASGLVAAAIGSDVVTLTVAGGILGAVAQAGDLFESAWKRRFHVKDSSRLIPGHGGVLDRMDGLIFATVAVSAVSAMTGTPPASWMIG